MSNFVTLRAKQEAAGPRGIDWNSTNQTFKAMLIDTNQLGGVDPATIGTISQIPVAARVGDVTMTGILKNPGSPTFNQIELIADPVVFPNQTGAEAEAMIVYNYDPVEAASWVLLWFDSADGLPVTPNSTDITVSVPDDIWWVF